MRVEGWGWRLEGRGLGVETRRSRAGRGELRVHCSSGQMPVALMQYSILAMQIIDVLINKGR